MCYVYQAMGSYADHDSGIEKNEDGSNHVPYRFEDSQQG
mgnify:CR=1 FL=1